MGSILQDVRLGLRRLRHAPGFALTAILTLALGIGATTAIFTLTYQVLLRSIPVEHPEQLYKVGREINCCVFGGMEGDWNTFSFDLYRHLRDHTPMNDGMAAVSAGTILVSGRRQGEPAAQPLNVRPVSGNYFSVLGVKPFAGRLLRPEDDQEGAPPVAVLSHAVWQSKFHGDPGVVGETMLMTGHAMTIVGISAAGFLGERNTSDPAGIWIPLAQEPLIEPDRKLLHFPATHWLDVLVRISDPKAVPVVESAIKVELLRWVRANRDPASGDTEKDIAKQTTELASASGGINDLREQYKKSLTMLQLIAGFVLLIACANLANLLLVRAVARRQELSVRSALGAPRSRLIRELLTEALLLSLMGGTLALAVAYGGVKGMLALAMKGVEIDPLSASPSLPVLGFALAVSIFTGVLFGIAPAWIASRLDPAEALRGANRSTGETGVLQRGLVVIQVALSVALLSTAGLLILSLQRLQKQDFHFQPEGRLIAFIDLQAAGYQYEQLAGLYQQIDQAFAGIPGLHDAAYATYGPMAFNNWSSGVAIEGDDPNAKRNASYSAVSAHFFEAVGTRILKGRGVSEHDTATSVHVAVVNKTFVDKFLQGKEPIGMHFGSYRGMTADYEIVGVADDSKYGDPSKEARPMYFVPILQIKSFETMEGSQKTKEQFTKSERYIHYASNLIVRYEGDPVAAAKAVRLTLQRINPSIPVLRLTTYGDQVSNNFTRQELVVRLTVIFGLLALVLASIGLYGVTAYGVARRIPEIGLRMALGADRASVVRLVLHGALMQTLIGLLLGIPGALLAGHYLQSQLYEVKGYDLRTLLGASVALAVSALVASVLPARRASGVEPMQALRTE